MEGFDDLAAQSFNLYAEYDGTAPTKAIVEIDLTHRAEDYAVRLQDYYENRIDRLMNPSGSQPRDDVLLNRLQKAS